MTVNINHADEHSNSRLILPTNSIILLGLGLIVFMDAADAYAIGGIPMPWIGMAAAVPLIIVHALLRPLLIPPATGLYLTLLVWFFGNTIIQCLVGDYSHMMPYQATTPYPVFVILRGYSFLGFILLLIIIYNYSKFGDRDKLVDFVVWIGVLVTLYSFYVLLAQRLQLPMIPKTRFGTGEDGAIAGGETGSFGDGTTRFLFRTIGSFREPSFLGIWLIGPFFYSLAAGQRSRFYWRTIVIGLGILSTASLTAAVATTAAFLVALQMVFPLSKRSFAVLGGLVGMMVVLGLILNWIGTSYFNIEDGFSFIDQYLPRIQQILEGGMAASNRNYAFEEFMNSEFSLVGSGLGNAHLADHRSVKVTIAFLSLYFHAWFAGGAIGLGLLILYLLMPLVLFAMRYRYRTPDALWYLSPYLASLLVFSVNDENFNIMAALIVGLLWAYLSQLGGAAVGRRVASGGMPR